jgi:hypothetical protein
MNGPAVRIASIWIPLFIDLESNPIKFIKQAGGTIIFSIWTHDSRGFFVHGFL